MEIIIWLMRVNLSPLGQLFKEISPKILIGKICCVKIRMVSIRKRVSKKNTRRQRREKKQRGGQNNQQNRIERLAQNELQNKSQRGGGGGLELKKKFIINKSSNELEIAKGKNETVYKELEVWASGNIYFIKKGNEISESYHADQTLANKKDVIKAYLTELDKDEDKRDLFKKWTNVSAKPEFNDPPPSVATT